MRAYNPVHMMHLPMCTTPTLTSTTRARAMFGSDRLQTWCSAVCHYSVHTAQGEMQQLQVAAPPQITRNLQRQTAYEAGSEHCLGECGAYSIAWWTDCAGWTSKSRLFSVSTVTSLCKDTQCKDILDVRTTQLGTSYCVLTAVAPLNKDNLV